MSTSVTSTVPIPNFARMNLNVPKMQLPVFQPTTTPVVLTNTAVSTTTTPVLTPPTQTLPTQVLNLPVPDSKVSVFQPIDFLLDLNSVDPTKLESSNTQEQQYKSAGFSFKVPRVKTALTDATVDKDLTRTMDNIERGRPNSTGTIFTPLSHLSAEDRSIIARAQTEYNELVIFRKDAEKGGIKQHEKELKAWNEMTHKVLVNGVEQEQKVPSFTKVLRDVFTLEFKSEDDATRFGGDADNKKEGLLKSWTKEHKKVQDKLSIRTKRPGPKTVVIEIVFNGSSSTSNPAITVSDELVASFNTWFQVNGAGVQCSYQRVTGEYKTKLVKDKKTGQLVPQDKKKPSDYVLDPIAKMDQWKAALFMVNRLRNRFSDELHVAVTVFIDYLVKQFAQVAIIKCHASKKARVMVKHVLENTHQIELFPLIANFRSYQAAVLAQQAQLAKGKLQGTTVGNVPDEKDDKDDSKKHRFEYCVFGVCKQLIKELKELNPNAGFDRVLISSEFKQFMCEIVDELIQTFGPILRQEIINQKIKTVNVETFYSILGARLAWDRINFPAVKAYIEDRVNRYEQYDEESAETLVA